MEVYRRSSWLLLLLGFAFLAATLQVVQGGDGEGDGPSESECRPYIEKALKELETGEAGVVEDLGAAKSAEDVPTVEVTTDDSAANDADSDEGGEDEGNAENESNEHEAEEETVADGDSKEEGTASAEEAEDVGKESEGQEDGSKEDEGGSKENESKEDEAKEGSKEDPSDEGEGVSKEEAEGASREDVAVSQEETDGGESKEGAGDSSEDGEVSAEQAPVEADDSKESKEVAKEEDSKEDEGKSAESAEDDNKDGDSKEGESKEGDSNTEDSKEGVSKEDTKETDSKGDSKEGDSKEGDSKEGDSKEGDSKEDTKETGSKEGDSKEGDDKSIEDDGREKRSVSTESKEEDKSTEDVAEKSKDDSEESRENDSEEPVEDDLTQEIEIPLERRPRDHLEQLLKLDEESREVEKIVNRVADITLRDLKRLYENAIKPLEVLYKYRDLSNRHFGDPEIFSKPLVLFMGPWSGGKSSIINYLLDMEYNETALRTGAEPSPAYFNILMHGDEPEVLDGTQLAADFTFSGLQKFGQGLEERLRGHKLPAKLLEKINIVEIPGILEVRKQISRLFPFNDACQWFIDRADIIFLVYDPSKLDVGPETEAILDQLKGREHQTRIILNKADQVKPEELMRVQGALIWNISPLMSSAQPPIMYTTSLWSRPYESWAPVRLLQAQERAFLRDLRSAYDHRIENKIASARRFAVRVRNHAKMVDCYLTTYYNHKSVFGNRKQVADMIIEHPQDYHIYEGLSTLTNISRYDLPDPDVYRDFFRLNPLYEFQQLSATCTYFRGCPINRLDVAIAYDLPELVGKHKKMVESALAQVQSSSPES